MMIMIFYYISPTNKKQNAEVIFGEFYCQFQQKQKSISMDKFSNKKQPSNNKKPSILANTKKPQPNLIPLIKLEEDDPFSNNYFIQDYDNANPYLNKSSYNRDKITSRLRQTDDDDTKHLQESILSDRSLGNIEFQPQKILKLPQIDLKKVSTQKDNKSQKYISSLMKKFEQDLKSIIPKQNLKKSPIQNHSVIDTRVQTTGASLIQDSSSASLLLKSSRNSIDPQLFSYLKISKIARRNSPESEGDVSNSQHLKSRVRPDHSQQFVSLTVPNTKRLPYHNPIMEEEDTTSSSNDDDEYIKDCVPGPGHYSIENHSSLSKPQTNRSFNAKNLDFGSKSSRFKKNKQHEEDSLTQLKLQQYLEKQRIKQQRILNLNKNKQKKIIPFNCKAQTQRQNLSPHPSQKIVSPVYYSPRLGIQQDLIKKIQRNFKSTFGSDQNRFRTIYRKPYNIGPGSYDIV